MMKSTANRSSSLLRKLSRLLPILLLAACGKGGGGGQAPESTPGGPPKVVDVPVQMETTGETDPSASTDAVHGGTFIEWGGDYPKSLNVWLDSNSFSGTVCGLMFSPLVDLHSTEQRPVGDIASSWEISADKKTYTFHLDPAAKWSDGKPVTAEDVQFYYDVMMNPKNLTSQWRVDLSRFSRPEVVDEHTVRLQATEAHWKNFWTAGEMTPLPKHAWAGKDFNSINFDFPVVNGPYTLDEVNTNHSVRLKRRGDWWGRVKQYNEHKYNFDYLEFKSMDDQVKVLEFLKTGGFDLYPIYTARIWAEQTNFPQIQKNWIVKQAVYNSAAIGFQGLAMNLRRPLFQDIRVRQALADLLDREMMNEKLMFNEYFLLNSYFPDLYPNDQNPNLPVTKYDPDKARELLKEAGWVVGGDGMLSKDGQPFNLTILHHSSSDLRHLNIYLEDLKKVGINANLEIVSFADWTRRVDNHEFDIVWAAWGDSRLRDPEAMWSSKTADDIATQNICGLKDPEVDKLIDEQKTEMDLAKRDDIDRQLDARLMQLCPYVLMWQSPCHRLLYWNRFGTPKYVLSKYGDEQDSLGYWWYDDARAAALNHAMSQGTVLPALPAKVHYGQ
ncbi:MAG TPA: extracellular solute-binding protein [Chthoniobacteraceae bacterium]|jgi:microcin C transport system substrate-binding protein|nr:extracellular solute-binding protein [Chthoniobacteraceae bacterium]